MGGDGRICYAYDNGLHVSELRARALRKEQSCICVGMQISHGQFTPVRIRKKPLEIFPCSFFRSFPLSSRSFYSYIFTFFFTLDVTYVCLFFS